MSQTEGGLSVAALSEPVAFPLELHVPFWARGYAVSTVGFELEQVKASIRDQEGPDDQGRL
jgi:hypothetical protein